MIDLRKNSNVAARVTEFIRVLCPVCGETVSFRPIVTGVQVRSANAVANPHLVVGLQAGTVVPHACEET